MTKLINTFAGGTNGAAITTANSAAGGTAFDVIGLGTGATAVYDTSVPGGGDVSAKFTTTGTASISRVGWNSKLGAPAVVYNVFYVYFTAFPSVTQRIVQYLSSSNATRASIFITAAGQVQVTASNGGASGSNRTTAAINLNALTRIETRIEMNTAGVPTIRLYNTSPLTSTTPTETKVGVATDFGGLGDSYHFGIPSQSANIGPVYITAVGMSDTDWIGPDLTAPNTAPAVALFTTSNRYAWGDEVTINGTVSDPDNAATHTTAWTVPTKPSGSTLTIAATTDSVTFTPDKPGSYTVRATATDNAAATAFAETTFTVVPALYVKSGGAEVPARMIV